MYFKAFFEVDWFAYYLNKTNKLKKNKKVEMEKCGLDRGNLGGDS